MVHLSFSKDPRFFQIFFQVFFLTYGILFLEWEADWQHYGVTILSCLVFNYLALAIRKRKWPSLTGKTGFSCWGLSVLISALSLCLLLKTNYWPISLLAAALTVISKYTLRINGKHLFNPSAFGIISTVLLTKQAWISPGQWGTGTVLFFAIISLGFIVVTRVQKLDVSLGFLICFAGLLYFRQVIYLDWPLDFYLHSISTGSLLLFSFFMISDPRTSPDHPLARIIWAVMVAGLSFYLSAFAWKNNTPVWVLVAAAPLVPVMDRIFKAKKFIWAPEDPKTILQ
ncbi:MAG: Na+-transporting NADH:ubiquinone oxidoreductase, subunit NqrB [Terrimonas sp.]|nr:Na+-transporting NADH:ubiquinone oxidoreductase, subunit NqrB [Terrimonas sp.]